MNISKSQHVWTVAEAKAKLSEILRLAETEGPQRIGIRKSFILVPDKLWQIKKPPKKHMGKWLVENMPRGTNLPVPDRREPGRKIPFIDEDDFE
ncbi:MAG: hypothetical protein OXH82_05275 [Candidatus Dadabacteria bacterium]|nr:hypothetical protein [Candidatus Dadabacteria bacterium]MDE0663317.1 hypothetical protein [Candidatus Dadabacteria bacterium]